jgi:Fe-S-cluster containining protein
VSSWPELDRLCRAVGLFEPSSAILRRLKAAYAAADRDVASGTDGRALPCGKGCADCCHESVFVSAPEWIGAVWALCEAEQSVQQDILRQMVELARRYEDEFELLESLQPGPERDEVAARVRFRCPILAADGACRIYRWRELNARTFGQAWDARRGHAFGCHRTHAQVGHQRLALVDAWDQRARLARAFPEAGRVHVHPWWFDRFRGPVQAVWRSAAAGGGAAIRAQIAGARADREASAHRARRSIRDATNRDR